MKLDVNAVFEAELSQRGTAFVKEVETPASKASLATRPEAPC